MGKIFLVVSWFQGLKRGLEIIKVHKKKWILENILQSSEYLMLHGAITSSLDGKIYISGSQIGKTKEAISIDTKL
jgi:hypothetical protein